MTPLFSLSAIRRKFFLCRQAWKNRILVQFFSLMACSKASIPTDIKQVKAAFKNKPAPSELKHRPQFASMVEALQGINEPHAVVVSKPIVGPQVVPAVTQSSILIENFLRPVPQYRDIPCRKQQVTNSTYNGFNTFKPQAVASELCPGAQRQESEALFGAQDPQAG